MGIFWFSNESYSTLPVSAFGTFDLLAFEVSVIKRDGDCGVYEYLDSTPV
jgi:hypothetical protein